MESPAVALPADDTPDAARTTLSATRPSRRGLYVWGTLFGVLTLLMATVAAETVLHFLGPAIDGPFQLYNALRRIAAGQRAGVDFQFFHGLGLPFLHYPFFLLFGGTFFASEAARQLVSALLYPVVAIVFLKTFARDWTRTLALAALVMAGSIALRLTSLLVALNSLLGVRSTLPTLFAVIAYRIRDRRLRVASIGLVLGLSIVFGTEQGLALLLAFVLVGAVSAWRSRDRRAVVVDAAISLAIGIVTLFVALAMLGGTSGMRGALTYNLRLVPMDQYWYFGAPPNRFITSWSDLPRALVLMPRVPITIALAIAAVAVYLRRLWHQPDGDAGRRHAALAVVAAYALISCVSLLGIYVAAYVQPCLRVLLLLGALEFEDYARARDDRLGRGRWLGVSRPMAGVIGWTVVCMILIVGSVVTTLVVTLPHTIRDHIIRHEGPVYSGIWPATLVQGQRVLDARRGADHAPPTLWSTYAGLLEARNGVFHPDFDYIIHALGPANRARYVQRFAEARPRLVQTVKPSYTQYEAWIEQTSWEFYEELLRNYAVVGETPWSFFWERQASSAAPPRLLSRQSVAPGTESIHLPTLPEIGGGNVALLLDVEVHYRIRNPLHALPIVGGLPRYLIKVDRALNRYPITLDPYTTTARFPVIARSGTNPVLEVRTFSLLPGARADITDVQVSLLSIDASNIAWFKDLVAQQAAPQP